MEKMITERCITVLNVKKGLVSREMKNNNPEVTRRGALDMQVCVSKKWTDKKVKDFADRENPCGTDNGWSIRKQGSKWLAGADERVSCDGRKDFVHIMLDA